MNNFKRYNLLHDEVIKRLEKGEITTEQARTLNDCFFDKYVNNDIIYTEKATREQYRMKSFKKKYKYNEKDKTILVDGRKYKVDLDINNPYILDDNGNKINIRTTSTNGSDDDPIIILDKTFFKLKNIRRRDAVLQHEIAHQRLHGVNKNAPNLDHDNVSSSVFDNYYNNDRLISIIKSVCKNSGININDSEARYKVIVSIKKDIQKMKQEYLQLSSKSEIEKRLREDIYNIAKKYESKYTNHANAEEFEADRYAANRTSVSDVKKASRQYRKYSSSSESIKNSIKNTIDLNIHNKPESDRMKSMANTNDNINKIKKELNKKSDADYNARRKALNDKDMKNNNVYK